MYHTPNTFLREKKNRSPTTPSKLPQSFHVANPVGLAVHIFASPLRRQSACDPPFSRARIHSRDFFYFATREFVESCRRGEGYRVRERYMQLPRPTALFGRRPGLVRRGKTEVGAPMANHEPSLPNGLPSTYQRLPCFEPQKARAHEGPPNLLLIRAEVPSGGAGDQGDGGAWCVRVVGCSPTNGPNYDDAVCSKILGDSY